MKRLKKIIRILAITVTGVIVLVSLSVYLSGPRLPADSEEVIHRVMNEELPEMIHGRQGMAENDSVRIWYECMLPQDSARGTILLVMGLGMDAMAWQPFFYRPFLDSGYQVIRFDLRGTGMSDWMENMDYDRPYTLEDMAGDIIAILDAEHIDKVHLVGLSMGGMIAQTAAIRFPERILSITSISSSGYMDDPDLPGIPGGMVWDLVKISLKYGLWSSEMNMIRFQIASRMLFKMYPDNRVNTRYIAQMVLYNTRRRRGYNRLAGFQHMLAIRASGSRYEDLERLNLPVLIVHGRGDPLVPFAHGVKCAEVIPGARTLWMDELGHGIPPQFAPVIREQIFRLIERDAERGIR